MFPQQSLTFHSWEIYTENLFVNEDLDYMIPKGISQTSIPNPKYILKKNLEKPKV